MTLADGQTSPTPCQTNSKEPQTNTPKPQNYISLCLLMILYVAQALPQGLLFGAAPIILMSKGAKYHDLLIVLFSYVPCCFKSFLTPLLNTFYFKKFGKGKTYMIPSFIIIAIMMLILARKGEDLFEVHSIPLLNLVSILTILILMPADLILDDWMISMIRMESSSHATTCQSIGFNLGFFISFNIFLPLNSTEFCNSYIFSEARDEPLIPLSAYLTGVAICLVLLALWILFTVKENVIESHNSKTSFSETANCLKIFLFNSHFRKLFFIYSTWNLMFGPIHNLFPGMILEKGVSKELFTNLNTPISPMLLFTTIWLGSLCKKFSVTKIANIFWISRLFATIFIYGALVYLHLVPEFLKIPIVFLASVSTALSFNGVSIALGILANRVAKETYGGPIMSTFGAIGSFSRFISDIFVFSMVYYFEWERVALVTMAAILLYSILFVRGLNSFDHNNLKSLLENPKKFGKTL